MHGNYRIIETVQAYVEAGDGEAVRHALPEETFVATPKLVWNPKLDDLDSGVLKRVYTRWNELHGPGTLSTAEETGLSDFIDDASNISVLRPVKDGWDFAYEHYGTKISQRTGFVAENRFVSTMPFSPGIKIHFTAGYRAVLAKSAPLLAWHVTPLDRSSSSWDRLILPLRAPDGPRILVCMEARAWNLERPHCD